MKITIIGTGYVGLVTGVCFSSVGHQVICLDVDNKKINNLKKGISPISEPGLNNMIRKSLNTKSISFSSNIKSSISKSDIIFIAVGTPMNKDGSSNLDYIYKASEDIGKHIRDGTIVITKSTIPVGTTHKVKEIISQNIIDRDKEITFNICNNPEFLKEGKAIDDFMYPDRIIIGLDNLDLKNTLKRLYKPFSIKHDKLIFMDILSSELTKYAANVMLATKISFINELSNISELLGADINKVRIGIGSDPRIGYEFIYPGIGYGGSCFPKDIHSIINFSEKYGYSPKILKAVNKVNNEQRKYFFNKFFNRFKDKNDSLVGKNFAIWGLSFKPQTDDMRESPSIYFIKNIIRLGGGVSVYDPVAMDNARDYYFQDMEIKYGKNKMDILDDSDALILITEWLEFRSPDFDEMKSRLKNPILFDARNQFDKNVMIKREIEYHQIGVPSLKK